MLCHFAYCMDGQATVLPKAEYDSRVAAAGGAGRIGHRLRDGDKGGKEGKRGDGDRCGKGGEEAEAQVEPRGGWRHTYYYCARYIDVTGEMRPILSASTDACGSSRPSDLGLLTAPQVRVHFLASLFGS